MSDKAIGDADRLEHSETCGARYQSLKLDPDVWQSKSFDDWGKVVVAQLRFWLSALL